jgi:hypothetical protein
VRVYGEGSVVGRGVFRVWRWLAGIEAGRGGDRLKGERCDDRKLEGRYCWMEVQRKNKKGIGTGAGDNPCRVMHGVAISAVIVP